MTDAAGASRILTLVFTDPADSRGLKTRHNQAGFIHFERGEHEGTRQRAEEVVALAQRMEQLAPPDGIALSQHTQKPVDGFFAVRSLGPLHVKGGRASPSTCSSSRA